MKKAGINARGRINCFPDAALGWAAFEEMVLDARQGVRAAFESFDPDAPLHSPRARRVGETWFDLIVHTLGRGVPFALAIDDPGPQAAGLSEPQRQIAALCARIEAAPHEGRRCGDTALEARAHPGRQRYRMNLAVVDSRELFVARRGPARNAAARDLTMVAHGPLVEEAVHFLEDYADICAGQREPTPARRLLRTLSRPGRGLGHFLGPQTVANEIESAHHMLIRRAERLIYIETQSFDSRALADHLVQRGAMVPELNLILVLPETPAGREAERCLKLLNQGFGPRFLAARAPGGCTNISVFDDTSAIAGSVDLGLRGLRRDAGVSLYLRAADGVAALRAGLSQHWIAEIAPAAGAADWRARIEGSGLTPI